MKPWIGFFLAGFFFCSAPAVAGGFYYEFGGGLGLVSAGGEFFGNDAPSETNFGLSGNFMVGKNLSASGNQFLQFHLGIKTFYITSRRESSDLVYWPTLLMVRIQNPRFYIGGGITPFVMKKYTSATVGGNFEFSPSTLAAAAEAGVLWRVTHFFNIALEASAHMARGPSGTISPKPALTGSLQFRVYFTEDGKSSGQKFEYDGWRYPFGIEIND